MAAEDTDTPLIVRVPTSPEALAATTAGDARERPQPVRAVAKVVKPGPVRARAIVPGALSIPRPEPSRSLRLGQAAMPFPRRVFPKAIPDAPGSESPAIMDAPDVKEGPSPAPAEAADHLPNDGPDPVRKKGLTRRAALPVLAAAVAAFVGGTGYLAVTGRPEDDFGRWGALAESSAPAPSATPAERPAGDPFGSLAAAPTGAPTRLRVGAIKVDTPLETLRIGGDGALQPPKTFAQAGWYADGTAPGDTGPAVIAGHVDSRTGPAVFYRLRELTTGDRVDVVRGGRTVSFTVTAIRWYPKAEFPTEEVYGPTPDRQLRLITCGGVFDRSLRSYRDNLVVYAVAG